MKDEKMKKNQDSSKKDLSLNEIFNFAQVLLKKSENDSKGHSDKNGQPNIAEQLKNIPIDSLLSKAQSLISPSTISLLSKSVNAVEKNEKNKETTSTSHVKQDLEQLSAEISHVKETLAQTQNILNEKDLQLKNLQMDIQHLKRRRRR